MINHPVIPVLGLSVDARVALRVVEYAFNRGELTSQEVMSSLEPIFGVEVLQEVKVHILSYCGVWLGFEVPEEM